MASLLLSFTRWWMAFLAIFELPNIYQKLPVKLGGRGQNFADGMAPALPNGNDAVNRLWVFMLTLLVAPRTAVALWPNNYSVMGLCALVHILEAIYFGVECFCYRKGGPPIVIYAVFFNHRDLAT